MHERRTPTALADAAAYFSRAIERDPDYALAHAALAECCGSRAFLGCLPPDVEFPKAIAAASRSLQLDEGVAEGHAALALCQTFYSWHWEEAERGFRRAIELTPSYPVAHMGYSHLLALLGRADKALEEAELALELDPLSPMSRVCVAMRLGERRQFDRAMDQLHAALALDPKFGTARLHCGRLCFAQGRYDQALTQLQQAPPGFPLVLGLRGAVLARLGRRQEAIDVLGELAGIAAERYVGAVPFALVHQGLGDLDAALEWYARAFEAHEGIVPILIADPALDALRFDARFAALVGRMSLPNTNSELSVRS
jgi:serine/threonine-protein kinase